MKQIYSILMCCVLLLCLGTSCEDDYRDVVFFSGDEPIYQLGTCDNLVGNVSFYLVEGKQMELGVDGGDGHYKFINNNREVVELREVNGHKYTRIQITPKALGEATIVATDGDGATAILRIEVKEYKAVLRVVETKVSIVNSTLLTKERQTEVQNFFKETFPVIIGGRYELTPKTYGEMLKEGELKVYQSDAAVAPLTGTYHSKEVSWGGDMYRALVFDFDGKEHIYMMGGAANTRMVMPVTSINLGEDVTAEFHKTLPESVKIIRQQIVVLH